MVSISQPLLRDFGKQTNRAKIHIAQRNHEVSKWAFVDIVISTITETIFAFNDLFFAQRNLEVAERSRELARTLYKQNLRRVELGTMAPLDVVVAEAELARRSERVILADRIRLDQQNRLKNLLFDDIFRSG